MSDFNKVADAVYRGEEEEVKELIQKMIDAGVIPLDIVNQGLLRGMDIVSPKFKSGEMFIPEVLMSAVALGEGMKLVRPYLTAAQADDIATFVVGTVKGDLHDIGKNLVVMLLESGGFNVIDLGVDVSADKFVQAVREHKPIVVGLCALLTTTMLEMKTVIDSLKEAGLRDKVKVFVGGAPVYPEFAEQVGADGYCSDAIVCKEMADKVVGIK